MSVKSILATFFPFYFLPVIRGGILPEAPWVSFKEEAPVVLESVEKLQMLGRVDETGFELEIIKSAA